MAAPVVREVVVEIIPGEDGDYRGSIDVPQRSQHSNPLEVAADLLLLANDAFGEGTFRFVARIEPRSPASGT